jgi:hypothetical protein
LLATTSRQFQEQPGCDVHAEWVVIEAHGVIDPLHPTVGLPAQEQPCPCLAWQAVCVVCALQACGEPLQTVEELQLQPYSPAQDAAVGFALQGLIVPVHVLPTSVQPWQ